MATNNLHKSHQWVRLALANVGCLISGGMLLSIAAIGAVIPITNQGHTVISLNDLCSSGLGQVAQALEQMFGGGQIQQKCMEFKYATYGIIAFGLIGIILLIVGAVIPAKQRTLICDKCGYATATEAEMINHHNEKHSTKSE